MFTKERIDQLRCLAGPLRSWFDPKSRKPLILLVAVSLAVLLAPLAWDVAKAAYFRPPPVFRSALAHGAIGLLGLLGLARLLTVKPTDAWPNPTNDHSNQSTNTFWDRALPWALRLAVLSLAWPLLRPIDGMGFADWDFVLDKFEALRRTILEWGQFPWWNPWCRGGFPLAAEPQIGAVSLATPFVLAFGTTVGLRIAATLCVALAFEGADRLGRLWFRDRWASAAVGLIYALNGAVIVNTVWGYVIPMSYAGIPWLALHAFRLNRSRLDGLALGFWAAFIVLNGIQYLSLYAAILAGLVWLRALRVAPSGQRPLILNRTVAAAGVCLLLCGWRLATVIDVLLDDAREWASFWDLPISSIVNALIDRPDPRWTTEIPVRHLADFIETTCYVGPLVVALGLASLFNGWRWWHTMILVSTWLAIGSLRWYQPSRWLADWPVFSSMHVVTRWRFLAMLGLGLAVGDLLNRWRHAADPRWRWAAALVVFVIAADYLSLAHQQFPLAFRDAPIERFAPGPPVPTIVNVRAGKGYPCVARGYGVIQGFEPMLGGYRRDAPTLRKAREDPDYQGEAWTDRGPVEPAFWSPNRIVFRVEPNESVTINQNPGSWWLVNGERAFAGLRCAELLVPFEAQADDQGRLELTTRPEGLEAGLALHALGLVMVLGAWRLEPVLRRRMSEE